MKLKNGGSLFTIKILNFQKMEGEGKGRAEPQGGGLLRGGQGGGAGGLRGAGAQGRN